MTTFSVRRPRAAVLTVTLLAALTACGGGSDDEADDGADRSDAPQRLADLSWDDSLLGEVDACGGPHVVYADYESPLHVVDVARDSVIFPEVAPPAGSDLAPSSSWLSSGGCVPTADGPVVVVETQALFVDLEEAPPKLVAGFTPEGEQLWAREEPGQVLGDYTGRGSFLLTDLSTDGGSWVAVDARTGETVDEGDTGSLDVLATVGPDLVATTEAQILRIPAREPITDDWTIAAQVDDDRMLVEDLDGVRLLRVADGSVEWTARGHQLLAQGTEVADLSTGVVVALGADRTLVGLDLETGKQVWASDLGGDDFNPHGARIGSGVVVLRAGDGLDDQLVVDTATGDALEAPAGRVVAAQGLLLLLDDGTPTPVTVDELR